MFFSIITICFNEERRIKKTLESVYRQDCTDYEHIIEDGGSTDGTGRIVNDSKRYYETGQLAYYSEKDEGIYDAMNRAILRSKGDYICFLNSGDSFAEAGVLRKVKKEINKYQDADIYYGYYYSVFENNDRLEEQKGLIDYSTNVDEMNAILSTGNLGLNHQAMFSRRECFNHNMFDTRYKLRAELDWYYSCIKRGMKIRRLSFPVSRYVYGGYSEKSSSKDMDIFEREQILNSYGYEGNAIREGYNKIAINQSIMLCIYRQWLALLQAGKTVSTYFEQRNYRDIAVYGYSVMGSQLINELLHRGSINIRYIIDREPYDPYNGIPVVAPTQELKRVDAIVITPITTHASIKQSLDSLIQCAVVSLEDVIDASWWE